MLALLCFAKIYITEEKERERTRGERGVNNEKGSKN
jgi:hypothetical protein